MNDYNIDREVDKLKNLNSYEISDINEIEEIDAKTVTLKHIKTGAKVFCVLKDDSNKTFTIGFRTPSKSSTGVQHILEHSVLCGSRKYPSKDPFIELVKGSLSTFLNAMTYPDRTIYPLSSCNDKDFNNLCDVYLDAVFFPNIYHEKKIFLQEGHHMELNDDGLCISGVVYNEMKGVYSSAYSALDRYIMEGLYEDHIYSYESGGHPESIPDLSYEDFLKFHETYYHPSNSYIFLYGNLDAYERLKYIDENYLNKFEFKYINSEIEPVKIHSEEKTMIKEYPILENEDEDKRYYLSLNIGLGDLLSDTDRLALNILNYYLISSDTAKIKIALLNENIGESIEGDLELSIRAPYFSIVAKNASFKNKDRFREIIDSALFDIVNKGIDKDEILSIINLFEFKQREFDLGSCPPGIAYSLAVFSSWIYNADINNALRYKDAFKIIREKVSLGYFEELIKKYFIDNKFKLSLYLKPVKNLEKIRLEEFKNEMNKKLSNMSDKDKADLIKQNNELKLYQSTPSSKEDNDKLPTLHIKDLSKEPVYIDYKINDYKNEKIIFTDINTNGIVYLGAYFEMNYDNIYELHLYSLLKELLIAVGTKNYSYIELYKEIHKYTGNIDVGFKLFDYSVDNTVPHLYISGKSFYDNDKKMMELINEILYNTVFTDKKRIFDIIVEARACLKNKLVAQGHITAMRRAFSSAINSIEDEISGINYYKFLSGIDENNLDNIINDLEKLYDKFKYYNKLLTITCDNEEYNKIYNLLGLVVDTELKYKAKRVKLENKYKKEAFISTSKVNYVAVAGNINKEYIKNKGLYRVVCSLLNHDYLWTNIRVIGNAYGCMCDINSVGDFYITSYRDPGLISTIDNYKKAYEYFENYDGDLSDIERAIIGVIGEIDTPLTPRMKGNRALAEYIHNLTYDKMLFERNEIFNISVNDIRSCAGVIKDFVDHSSVVAVGNESNINDNKEYFNNVEEI